MNAKRDIAISRLLGLKIFMMGLIVAMLGFLLAVVSFPTMGWLIGWAGAIIAITGLTLNLALVLKHALDSRSGTKEPPLSGK